VAHGQVTLTTPSSVDADGNMNYSEIQNKLLGKTPIAYAGIKYQHNFKDGQIVGVRSAVATDGSRNVKAYYSWVF
jgi:hypothetical protein